MTHKKQEPDRMTDERKAEIKDWADHLLDDMKGEDNYDFSHYVREQTYELLNEIDAITRKVDALEAELKKKDKEIATLKAELAKKDEMIDTMMAQMVSNVMEIEDMETYHAGGSQCQSNLIPKPVVLKIIRGIKDAPMEADKRPPSSDPGPETAGAIPTRSELGKLVREVWIKWAREQPSPKPSWLVPWEQLSENDREVDRRIGETLYNYHGKKSEDEKCPKCGGVGRLYDPIPFSGKVCPDCQGTGKTVK